MTVHYTAISICLLTCGYTGPKIYQSYQSKQGCISKSPKCISFERGKVNYFLCQKLHFLKCYDFYFHGANYLHYVYSVQDKIAFLGCVQIYSGKAAPHFTGMHVYLLLNKAIILADTKSCIKNSYQPAGVIHHDGGENVPFFFFFYLSISFTDCHFIVLLVKCTFIFMLLCALRVIFFP